MPARDPLELREIVALLNARAFRRGNYLRNKALLAFMLATGCRIGEALTLRIGDVVDDSGAMRERINIQQHKQGDSRDCLLLGGFGREMLADYLLWINGERMVTAADWLFPGRGAGHLSYASAYLIFRDAAREAGLNSRIGCHSTRKTWADRMLAELRTEERTGAIPDALLALQELGGWKKVDSAARYVRRRSLPRGVFERLTRELDQISCRYFEHGRNSRKYAYREIKQKRSLTDGQ